MSAVVSARAATSICVVATSARHLLPAAVASACHLSVGQIDRKEFQRSIYLRQLMHQQLDRHGKQTRKMARVIAALYLACSDRNGHEKENLCF